MLSQTSYEQVISTTTQGPGIRQMIIANQKHPAMVFFFEVLKAYTLVRLVVVRHDSKDPAAENLNLATSLAKL